MIPIVLLYASTFWTACCGVCETKLHIRGPQTISVHIGDSVFTHVNPQGDHKVIFNTPASQREIVLEVCEYEKSNCLLWSSAAYKMPERCAS